MDRMDNRLERYLDALKAHHNYRTLKPGMPGEGAVVQRDGRHLINFSSNDYLGLARNPALVARAREWTEKWGVGSTASRLVCGTLELHERVESKLAALKGTKAALIFNSGYQANSTILPALFDRKVLGTNALVFTDRLVHASIHDGCRGAGVRQIRFRHNDMNHLEALLKVNADKSGVRFILTETVFSMDGDRADLAALTELAERFGAFLYVDEAHATGVFGPKGMGLSGNFPGKIDLIMGTFSKALGSFGAYVACSDRLKEYFVNRCSGFIYSTALPPGVLGAMDAALDLVPRLGDERRRLRAHSARLRKALHAAGIDTAGSTTQIVPAVIGAEEAVLAASHHMENRGILGIAIRPPTVPAGTSRIRFAVTADHEPEDMDRLLDLIPDIAALSRASP